MNYVTHPLRSAEISIFHWKSASFAISENTNSFEFFLVFKYFFDKHGYNFDDVSKIGYSRLS